MGIKLNPPIIENTLPACYRDDKGMVFITIPFTMNRSVSAAQVCGFELKIKTIQTGSHLYTITSVNPNNYLISDKGCYVTFELTDKKELLKIGQFYKVQLAYLGISESDKIKYDNQLNKGDINLQEYEANIAKESTVGYYSGASTIKYTTKPKIYINNFDMRKLNPFTHSFTGYYDQSNGDITEKLYSYQFNIYDKNNVIVYSSGEQVHNGMHDDENFGLSFDTFDLLVDLEYNVIYYIQYDITTINKLILSSPKYRITNRETVDPEIHAQLQANLHFDDGYVTLALNPTEINVLDTGSFVIARSSEDSNYTTWEELYKFKMHKEHPKGIVYKDFTIEHGKRYQYSLQQYNDYDLYSKRILSNTILSDFEDGFLYDGDRQLKIRFNMKMSKLTSNILESKQETIGSKYPFFFRNGTVQYHEFPLNGLISYKMDDNFFFMNKEDLNLEEYYRLGTNSETSNFKDSSGEEIFRERIFKTEVLNWLNNGKPKLLKTPTEGNFIVRLMKVSLSPEDKLGRMLHNFSSTAYEIADYSSASLRKLGILKQEERIITIPQWKSINLNGASVHQEIVLNVPQNEDLTSLHFDDMWPGEIITLTMKDRSQQQIVIGVTGSYHIDNVILPIRSIKFTPKFVIAKIDEQDYLNSHIPYFILEDGKYVNASGGTYDEECAYYMASNNDLLGLITYSYNITQGNDYAHVKSVFYNDATVRQFIGEHDILGEINTINGTTKDWKRELTDLCYLKVSKRPVDRLIAKESTSADGTKTYVDYYYGTSLDDNQNFSEKLPITELKYPIGMRAYEPKKYWIYQNGTHVLDEREEWHENTIYYLKGQYQRVPDSTPIGLVAWEPTHYYVQREVEGKTVYVLDPGDSWDINEVYYERSKTLKGQLLHHEVKNMTCDEDHVFKPDHFYIIAGYYEGKAVYTWAKNFDENTAYYYIDDSKNGWQNAYVTINNDYVYRSYTYYIHLLNNDEDFPENNKDEYRISTEPEFNMHKLELVYGDVLDYEGEVLKYYKLKKTAPLTLYQIGDSWSPNTSRAGYDAPLYDFHPTKYIDFNNKNKEYQLDEYAPYIVLNNEIISVEDTIIYGPKNLNLFEEITELRSGNGVIVDVVYHTKGYEYLIEESNTSYQSALQQCKDFIDRLNLPPTDENYVDLYDTDTAEYKSCYNNSYQKVVSGAYNSLITAIDQKIGGSNDV